MNTDLRKKAKIDVEKDFFKLMNNIVCGKTRKFEKTQRYQTSHNRRNYSVSEPNFHTAKFSQKIY